ncbi:hypothetical protein BTO05_04160 [Winogradskyella sp. PC-19]|nr:hypothetical protein BTO05_04160 [Winogradskyella sp. PC-19]
MNKKTIDTIYKWTLRFYYIRTLLAGIICICFSVILIITDYKISKKEDFNLFIIIFSAILGIVFLLIGLFQKTETEFGIRNKWHEKYIE